jgi:hypothetical protein
MGTSHWRQHADRLRAGDNVQPAARHSHRRNCGDNGTRLGKKFAIQPSGRPAPGIDPVLSQYANDHRRLELVRDTCRQSVAEFIRRWLENEDHWKPGKFTAINVKFATEPVVPSSPTVQLLSFNQ